MSKFSDLETVIITVQRLYPRNYVVTVVVGPQGEYVGNFTVRIIRIKIKLSVDCSFCFIGRFSLVMEATCAQHCKAITFVCMTNVLIGSILRTNRAIAVAMAHVAPV